MESISNQAHWKMTKEGKQRASISADTKQDIIQRTREFMGNKTGSVKIHKENGMIQEERTYPRKKDPRNTPG